MTPINFYGLNLRFIFFGLFLLGAVAPSHADATTVPTINLPMSEIGRVMTEIYPLIVGYRELNAIEVGKISASIPRLQSLFAKAGPFVQRLPVTYQVSYVIVTDLLDELNKENYSNRIYTVRNRMRILGEICASCHTQDTKLRTLFSGIGREKFYDDSSYAEFNYITRNYPVAEIFYARYLLSDSPKTELEIIQPLQRLALVYTQILNKPKEGARSLAKFSNIVGHTAHTKKYLQEIIAGMESLDFSSVSDAKKLAFKDVEGMVESVLGARYAFPPIIYNTPKQEIATTWLRGILFHYLNSKASDNEVPYILYWLSVCDRIIGYNVFFSMSDQYLKACITRFPGHPFAQYCLDEFEQYLRFFETGPLSPELPIESYRVLQNLKRLVEKSKPATIR